MNAKQAVSIVVFVLGAIAALFYTSSDNEAQGTVVVLLAILFFVALPHITKSS